MTAERPEARLLGTGSAYMAGGLICGVYAYRIHNCGQNLNTGAGD